MKFKVKDVRPIVIRARKTKTELTRSRAINLAKEMATNPQEKQMLMKISQAEKENYHQLKQLMNKSM